jgi:hypothetical protein
MSMFERVFPGKTEAERLRRIMRKFDEEKAALARAKLPNHDERLKKISGVVVPISAWARRGRAIMASAATIIPTEGKARPILPVDYRVFLVNEGDHYLAPVGLYTGGFEGTGDRLVETSRTPRYLGVLPQGGSVLIEELDMGILDFVLWYHFDLGFADGVDLKAWFEIGKAYALRELRHSPALGTEGYYFPLKPRSKH